MNESKKSNLLIFWNRCSKWQWYNTKSSYEDL